MKSEKLKGLSSTPSYNYYTSFSVKTLPREKDCTDFSTTAGESDVEEYYPFVIGRGKSFQIVDPKVFKQLRKNNIRQSKHIRIAECAKKTSTKSKTTERTKSSVTSESEDEYCELSALAKSPAPLLPPRKITQGRKDYPRDSVKTVPSCEKRRQNEYYDPKQCLVQFNSNSSTVTTKFVSSADVLKKSTWKDSEKPIAEENFYEPSKKCFCGLETDEVVDYATCMCCVKGLFYHCTKDSEDEGRMADDPCSCSGPLKTCIPRWGCLAVFSVFLPCLWCFLPITGCRKAAKCVSCKNKKHERKSKKSGTKNLDFISQKQQQQ